MNTPAIASRYKVSPAFLLGALLFMWLGSYGVIRASCRPGLVPTIIILPGWMSDRHAFRMKTPYRIFNPLLRAESALTGKSFSVSPLVCPTIGP